MSLYSKVTVSHALHRNHDSLIPILCFCYGREPIKGPDIPKNRLIIHSWYFPLIFKIEYEDQVQFIYQNYLPWRIAGSILGLHSK